MSLINYLEQIIGNLELQVKVLTDEKKRLIETINSQRKLIEEYKTTKDKQKR